MSFAVHDCQPFIERLSSFELLVQIKFAQLEIIFLLLFAMTFMQYTDSTATMIHQGIASSPVLGPI